MKRLQQGMALGLLMMAMSGAMRAADVAAVIDWSQRVELGTLVSGVVSEVHVRPGDSVNKGDPLVSLDRRGFGSQVSRRAAEYRHAQALLEEAVREDGRAAELYDRTVLSDFERNQAHIALEAARARAESARAALVDARLDLERSVVQAPFDGVVLAVNATPGQTVVSELQIQPLVAVAANRVLRGRALVDGAAAAGLVPGQTLSATARGRTLTATVAYVGFEPVPTAGSAPAYQLLVDIPAEEGESLRVGETVTLKLD